jgi:iron complex outermembrane recepter protein
LKTTHPILRNISIILLSVLIIQLPAQSISGKLADSTAKPVPYVLVALLHARDSVIYKGTTTDDNGQFEFHSLKPDTYLVRIKDMSYSTYYSQSIIFDSISNIIIPVIQLTSVGKQLDEVDITAIKRPFEFKGGNITVNVEDSPLAIGNSVYDLLSRTPGVRVDNENISIQGRTGVAIYIDDRRQPFSGQQLINLLRSMSASSVEKLEIIRNPSAKYDAAGTGGIINITMKRLRITGTSGTAGYTYSKGYASTNNANFSLNYKGRHLSLFSSIEGYEGTLSNTYELIKTIPDGAESITLHSLARAYDVGKYLTFNFGADWSINKMNTVGVRFQGVPGYALRTQAGNNALSDNTLGYENLVYKRTVPNSWYLANYNLNAEHLFDTVGTKIKFSTDVYGPYSDIYTSNYDYQFTDRQLNNTLPPRSDKASITLDLRIISGRMDFEKKLSKSLLLEAGIKGAYQDIFSNYEFRTRNNITGEYNIDSLFTNRYVYNELISASYINFQKEYKKFSYQAGLRAENTEVNSSSDLRAFAYNREYFKLFPNASFNYNPTEDHAWSVAFNRRIWRPDYNSFNPYYVFNNLFSISRGNPYLLPEFFYVIEVSHVYKSRFTNAFSFSRSDSPIRGQTQQVDSTRVTYFQLGNLQRSNESNYFISYNGDVKKWWNLTLNLGGWYYDFYGMVDDQLLDNYAFSYSGYMNNVLLLPKQFKLEISGWYVGPWLYGGFYTISPRGALNLGLKRSFLKDRLTLSMAFHDVFFTAVNDTRVSFNNQQFRSRETYDSRRFNASVNYNFGRIKAEKRQVKRADEEQGRIGR